MSGNLKDLDTESEGEYEDEDVADNKSAVASTAR